MHASTFGSISLAFISNTRDAIAAASDTIFSLLARVAVFISVDSEQRARARQEAYLADSVDRYELEYRMRELDRADARPYWLTGLHR